MKTPTSWVNSDGTGAVSNADVLILTTEASVILTTESGDTLTTEGTDNTAKASTEWDAASKDAQTWRVDGYARATNFTTSTSRITEQGDTRITEQGDARIVEDAYIETKQTTEWSDS